MLLDTNILIAYLANDRSVVPSLVQWRKTNQSLFISTISITEILALTTLSEKEMITIKHFLEDFIPISLDVKIAETAAYFRKVYRLGLPDAEIAATAFVLSHPLVTRDRQFQKISELTVVDI